MTRPSRSTDSDTETPLWTFLLFAIVTGIVGFGLLAVSFTTSSRVESAIDWVEVPCTIEESKFVSTEDGRFLKMEYRYVFEAAEYVSDRLDLLPGSMGDDSNWERGLYDRYPVNSDAVCFVDPKNPSFAVLDRAHGPRAAGNLKLLAFPFVCMSCGFALAMFRALANRRSAKTPRRGVSVPSIRLGPPPRQIGLWTKLNVIFGGPTPIAWLFLVGFSFVFVMLEGREHAQAIFSSFEATEFAPGRVLKVAAASQREFEQQVFEYEFEFQDADQMRTGKSFSRHSHSVGDRVQIEYPASNPERAIIAGERSLAAPAWVVAIPGGVVLLLSYGLLANYWVNWRCLQVLRDGQLAEANRLKDKNVKLPHAAHELQPPPFVFDWNGKVQLANALPNTKFRDGVTSVNVAVLPNRPKRNIVVESLSMGTGFDGQAMSPLQVLPSLAIPALGTVAIVYLFFWL